MSGLKQIFNTFAAGLVSPYKSVVADDALPVAAAIGTIAATAGNVPLAVTAAAALAVTADHIYKSGRAILGTPKA